MPEIGEMGEQKMYLTAEELTDPEEAKVEGVIPDYVKGTLYRSGPGKFDINGFTVNHWLDGYAIILSWKISRDKVIFNKKYLQSDAYKRALAAGKPVITEFGTKAHSDPNKGFFSRVVSTLMPEFTDNGYSTPFTIGNDLFTTADTCFFRKIDPDTLETLDKCDTNKLFAINSQSAHPITVDGETYNIGVNLGVPLKYTFYKIPETKGSSKESFKKAKTICSIPCRWNAFIGHVHSFGMSENYIVFVEQPFGINILSLVKGGAVIDWLEWRGKEEKNRFYVIEKATGKVIKTEFFGQDSFYFMHFINTFEVDIDGHKEVIIDINIYKSPNILQSLYLEKIRKGEYDTTADLPQPTRFVIPLLEVKDVAEGVNLLKYNTTATAIKKGNQFVLKGQPLTKQFGLEMPQINRNYFSKEYTYFYGTATINPCTFSSAITKVNIKTKEQIMWKENDKENKPAEPIFVQNPGSTEEDDGILISAVTVNKMDENDFIVFLRAKDLKEVARCSFKASIPLALHGLFLPQS